MIDSSGDSSIVVKRKGTTIFTIRVGYTVFKGLRGSNLQMNRCLSGVKYADVRLQDADSIMFFCRQLNSSKIRTANEHIGRKRNTIHETLKLKPLTYTDTD